MDSTIVKSYFIYRTDANNHRHLTYIVCYNDGSEKTICSIKCFVNINNFKNRLELAKEIIKCRLLCKTAHKPSLKRIKELNTIISEYIKDSING